MKYILKSSNTQLSLAEKSESSKPFVIVCVTVLFGSESVGSFPAATQKCILPDFQALGARLKAGCCSRLWYGKLRESRSSKAVVKLTLTNQIKGSALLQLGAHCWAACQLIEFDKAWTIIQPKTVTQCQTQAYWVKI